MGEVHDARVCSVERVRRILAQDAGAGVPDVNQVVVWLDHYGLFDGEHRVFQNVNVNLQMGPAAARRRPMAHRLTAERCSSLCWCS